MTLDFRVQFRPGEDDVGTIKREPDRVRASLQHEAAAFAFRDPNVTSCGREGIDGRSRFGRAKRLSSVVRERYREKVAGGAFVV